MSGVTRKHQRMPAHMITKRRKAASNNRAQMLAEKRHSQRKNTQTNNTHTQHTVKLSTTTSTAFHKMVSYLFISRARKAVRTVEIVASTIQVSDSFKLTEIIDEARSSRRRIGRGRDPRHLQHQLRASHAAATKQNAPTTCVHQASTAAVLSVIRGGHTAPPSSPFTGNPSTALCFSFHVWRVSRARATRYSHVATLHPLVFSSQSSPPRPLTTHTALVAPRRHHVISTTAACPCSRPRRTRPGTRTLCCRDEACATRKKTR